MADLEKQEKAVTAETAEEEERFLEGMAVVDFDLLCSTVALQTQGRWTKLQSSDEEQRRDLQDGYGHGDGGVLRMWEGELLDCFHDRRIAIESTCCPCYRFGKNMRRAGFSSCFLQGTIHLILVISALANCIAFVTTERNCFLYLSIACTISVGIYLGFFRTQMKKKFNIRGNDNSLDDCIAHLICPCCTLSQESRTLEMNNIQDGIWHGQGDTICIGSFTEGRKTFFELQPPHAVSPMVSEAHNVQVPINFDSRS